MQMSDKEKIKIIALFLNFYANVSILCDNERLDEKSSRKIGF